MPTQTQYAMGYRANSFGCVVQPGVKHMNIVLVCYVLVLFIELDCCCWGTSVVPDWTYLANVPKLGICAGTLWPVSTADLFSEIALAERLILLMFRLQSPSKQASCCKNDQTADKHYYWKYSTAFSVSWHWLWISCVINASSVSCNKNPYPNKAVP